MPVRAVAPLPGSPRIVELPEWQSVTINGAEFVDEDRATLNELISGEDDRVHFSELKSGIRVSAKSWVGTVRFSTFEVRIVPKLPGTLSNLARMLRHAVGFDDLAVYRLASTVDMAEQCSLLEIVAMMFAGEAERLVRNGLLSDYRTTEDDLAYLRGRLLPERQFLKRFGLVDRVECRYDEHVSDITENRLVLCALLLGLRRIESPDLSRRLSRLAHLFSEACSLDEFDLPEARMSLSNNQRNDSYNRRNEHYRTAHELAWFLIDSLGIRDMYQGRTRCYAFLFDMNPLFERLVGKWLAKAIPPSSLSILEQCRCREVIWNAGTNKPYASIRPDYLLKDVHTGDIRLALDAKYKRYGVREIDPADIYQTFVYAFGLVSRKAGGPPPEAFLIHPAEEGNPQPIDVLQVRKAEGEIGAGITVLPVAIPSMLDLLDGKGTTDPCVARIFSAAMRSGGRGVGA